LDKENSVLVGGELKPIHESSVWDGVLIRESTWFAPDANQCANAMYAVFKNYSNFKKISYFISER